MKKNYTLVQVGYNRFCFADQMQAIQFYQLVSQSIPVENNYGALPDGRKHISWIRDDSLSLGIEQADEKNIELQFTKEELKERAEASKDLEGHVELIDVTEAPREIGFDPL